MDSPVTVEPELNRYSGAGGASRVRVTYEASSGTGSSNTDPPYTYPVLTKLEAGAF